MSQRNRLVKELNEASKSKESEIKLRLKDENLYHWEGLIQGPSDTSYDKGYFLLDINID